MRRESISSRAATSQKSPRPVLVLGGGAFACGYALSHPSETLILERGIHLAADFALTGESAPLGEASTELGRALLDDLRSCGIVCDGQLEAAPLADFMADFFTRHGGQALMAADLVGLRKTRGGWSASVLGSGSEGVVKIGVADVLDTTDLGWQNFGADAIAARRLSAITDHGSFHVELPASADWREARLALHDAWETRADKTREFLAEAGAMKCSYVSERIARRTPLGFQWVPGAQFPDFLTAFEEGVKWKSV